VPLDAPPRPNLQPQRSRTNFEPRNMRNTRTNFLIFFRPKPNFSLITRHSPLVTLMTSLSHIQNWPERAQQAKWSASVLAKQCGVSVRTLERYFLKYNKKKPKTWLIEQRQQQALELLHDGSTIKEIAGRLGYKYSTHFSRQFKSFYGICPMRNHTNDKKQGEVS
jgi:transcriptional regulator GlxA family with amidase domain